MQRAWASGAARTNVERESSEQKPTPGDPLDRKQQSMAGEEQTGRSETGERDPEVFERTKKS